MLAATAAAATGTVKPLVAAPRTGPNGKLGVAVIGTGGRGSAHAVAYADRQDCEVKYLCDADLARAQSLSAGVGRRQGRDPQAVQDLRRVFDDKSVDVVSIATCNHWHALAAIWAMQAGKDVYVEKPVSHNVSEGRRMVQVARKHGRMCQAGTQYRSHGSNKAIIQYLREGKLGDVKLGFCMVRKRRGSIGPPGNYEPPKTVDYDLFCGPAPLAPITRRKFHYDWHWFWDFGNGDLGNSGIHRVDIARWALGVTGLGRAVMSYGGRMGYGDAGQTPNTQVTLHDFGDKSLVVEVRGLSTGKYQGLTNGIVIQGTAGYIASTQTSAAVFDPQGKMIQSLNGPGDDHFDNFLKAVRSRKVEDLHADILEGHQSSALCHLGNISHRLGTVASSKEILGQLADREIHDEVAETFDRNRQHLRNNGVDVDKTPLTLGPWLAIDAKRESFVGSPQADALLTRAYRLPFVVPSENNV
jgi:predicted dehydrogenase